VLPHALELLALTLRPRGAQLTSSIFS
jgi:hypothetical protein